MKKNKKHLRRGFTFVEVLIACWLIAILGAVALNTYVDYTRNAKIIVSTGRLQELKIAIMGDPNNVVEGRYLKAGFKYDIGSYPLTLSELGTRGAYAAYNHTTHKGWKGPYIKTSLADWNKDAWGQSIVYSAIDKTLRSCGPDKSCGNSDDILVNLN